MEFRSGGLHPIGWTYKWSGPAPENILEMREERNGTDNLLGRCPRYFNEALCPKWSEAEWRGNVLEWV
ncbi:MAG: hypothetical protein ACKVJF_07435 [Flavobacteriales bacterium]